MSTALYCYFGGLGTNFTADIPGHNFYQPPFINALKHHFKVDNIDFYSYVPVEFRPEIYEFPDDKLGNYLNGLMDQDINSYCLPLDRIMEKIKNTEYEEIILKARFRNLSTLTKKWDDAQQFEDIILTALAYNYQPSEITILDTDMSMPERFVAWAKGKGINIITPSIDFCPITKEVAEKLKEIHHPNNVPVGQRDKALYYGNLAFGNYKAGHAKNPIVYEVIDYLANMDHFGLGYIVSVAGKVEGLSQDIVTIPRYIRDRIWVEFTQTKLCLNVSKDLYVERGFLPARVYESLIFGALPVSYKMPQPHTALSFKNLHEFEQIAKFILEMSPEEYYSLYCKVLDNLTVG